VTTLDSSQLVLGCRFQFFVSARVRALSSFPHCFVPQIRAVSSKVLVFLRPGLDYRSILAIGLFCCSRLWVLFSSSPCLPARWCRPQHQSRPDIRPWVPLCHQGPLPIFHSTRRSRPDWSARPQWLLNIAGSLEVRLIFVCMCSSLICWGVVSLLQVESRVCH
jgi:hypothetical protein